VDFIICFVNIPTFSANNKYSNCWFRSQKGFAFWPIVRPCCNI